MQQFIKVPWNQYALDPNDGFMDSSVYADPSNETETRKQMQSQHSQLQNYINTTVKNAIEGLQTSVTNIWSTVYPVGAIYMSVNATSPQTIFGGTWVKIEDKFLLGSGTKSLGVTGGEETHRLTSDEMPNHIHSLQGESGSIIKVQTSSSGTQVNTQTGTLMKDTQSAGGGGSHNNMPPYLVVNIWKRTA